MNMSAMLAFGRDGTVAASWHLAADSIVSYGLGQAVAAAKMARVG
jgi:hypothetical protein